jgi:hypothetical protein
MSRKITYCLLVLAMASVANATPFTFGTWNDANNGYIDWGTSGTPSITTLMPSKYDYSTIGVTNGTKSLKMTKSGWNQNLAVRSYESPLAGYPNQIIVAFLDSANHNLAIDVTFVQSEWVPASGSNGYAQIQMTIQGTGISWTLGSMGMPDMDTGNPGYPGGWDGVNFPGTTTRTMYWNIDFLKDGNLDNGEYTGTTTSGYINFVMTTNCGNFSQYGSYYFDNMRIVPEPATMGLLGLGALALIRRKR